MDDSARRLAPRLKEIRRLAGLSHYSVSLGTGIDRSRLSSIENGYVCARVDEVEQIERFVADAQYQRAARLNRVLSVGQAEANDVGNRLPSNMTEEATERHRHPPKRDRR